MTMLRLGIGMWAAALLTGAAETQAQDRVQFNRDVRPILADKCFHCHGPDATHRQADLRLDDRDVAVAKQAIVPGEPESAGLVQRILSTDPDAVMPPPPSNKKLTPGEKETLRRWIAEGAEYQGHWAFLPPVRPPVPEVNSKGVVNPIDHFVRERLRREQLTPAPEADRVTLIRRVSLDLTGIPPTPEEIDAFLADTSPAAYENLVDRLLASPRYGERMAMLWLDQARYADSNGFQTDSSRQMWRWRDWVIDAFNRNLPFDRFTVEQLAGDLLANPTEDQLVATGFHRNPRLNGEGGRIAEEWFAETVIDRVDTTGQTWLGLTLGCCRCHDHKYDPITQKEFYELFAFFNSVDESGVLDSEGGNRGGGNSRPVLALPTEEQRQRAALLEATIQQAEAQVAATEKDLPGLQAAWEQTFVAKIADQGSVWNLLEPSEVKSAGGATLTRLEDGSWLASGKNPAGDTYVIKLVLTPGELTGLRIETFPDPSLPNQSLGRGSNGNYVLTGIEAEITAKSLPQPQGVQFVKAESNYDQPNYEFRTLLDGNRTNGWAIDGNDPTKRLPRKGMLLTGAAISVPEGATLTVRLKHESQFKDHNVGRFRIAVTGLPPSVVKLEGSEVPVAILAALTTATDQRSAEQRQSLAKFFKDNGDHPYGRAAAELAAARKQLADLRDDFSTTMVMKELPQPREAFILKRGEYDKKGDKVERSLPRVLPPLPDGAPLNRLGLATWLVSPEHPLTARVWVNRQWAELFGQGLVKTTDNFGMQSDPPSHPELLDWLATEFVQIGWNMKELRKRMVMSATYRQSSHASPELWKRDPDNRLLARGPRFRLPAELVRDQALAASGLLVEKTGGPSVRPYMPEGVWDETSKYGDLRGYKADRGEGLYRRTLYTIWKRTAAPPTMLMFDSPSREFCAVKRSRTNTPLQALALLNEVTYVEAARMLAQKMLTQGGTTPSERIAWGFRRVTGRVPDREELAILANGLDKHLTRYRAEASEAQRLIGLGEAPVDAALDSAELAAYTLTANVLFNLDEVVTKE